MPRHRARSGGLWHPGLRIALAAVLFLATFPAVTSPDDWAEAPVLIGAVFAGVMGWDAVLSSGVMMLRRHLMALALDIINKAAAATLAGLGVWSLLNLWAGEWR